MNRKQRRALGKSGPGASTPSAQHSPLFAEAVKLHQSGRLGEAERLCQDLLAVAPLHADAFHLLGVIAHQSGRHDAAADLIRRAIQIDGQTDLYHNNLGFALQAAKRPRGAVAAYEAAIEVNPRYADARYNLGNTFYELSRHGEALACFDAAIAIKPGHAEAHNNRGIILKDLGQIEEAKAAFETAIGLKPAYTKAHYNLGNALRALGQIEEAVLALKAAIDLNPFYGEAHNNLGVALQDLGRREAALGAFAAALQIKPDHAETHRNIAHVLRDLGRLEDATTAYETAIRLEPGQSATHSNLANVLSDLGRKDEAIACYRTAVTLGDQSAGHLLSALEGKTTDRAPSEYLEAFFDDYAARFEAHLTGTLLYRAPGILRMLTDRSDGRRLFEHMADLGCGTGLTALAFQDAARVKTGIDLSSKMIALAAQKNIYQHLLTGDIANTLIKSDARYDLFVMTDVVIYFGSLDLLFSVIRSCARPNARLAFSAEIAEGDRFHLLPSGRYAHSHVYLKSQLDRINASVLIWETHPLRLDKAEPCLGHYIVAALDPE